MTDEQKDDLSLVLAASLTLLALIIGFSFSMATNRYDQRKQFEEAEANAIGTEYLRADFLPPADAARVRALLSDYTKQRILFFINADDAQRTRRTDQSRGGRSLGRGQRTGRRTSGARCFPGARRHERRHKQGYTQAAYWNRIPKAAWYLLAAIALCCNLLFGYRMQTTGKLALVLPLVASISLLLIADIDAPRHGLIHVSPQNLESLSRSFGH